MRALVFGGEGMLGRAVVAEARRRGFAALGPGERACDVTDGERVAYWLEAFRPEVLFNCAAFTRVDGCEERRAEAFAANDRGVGTVVAAAQRAGLPLVHLSTDYVFDGAAREPYPEDAEPRPLSVYGESKLAGERRALAYERALVVRTSWLFGPGGPNFVETILGLIERGDRRLRVVDDQVGCPTYTPFLARALLDLAAREATGLVHFRNREPVSWHGFAREIASLVAAAVEVEPVATSEVPRPASRPAYSVLDVGRFEALVGRRVEPWGWGLAAYLARREERPGSPRREMTR